MPRANSGANRTTRSSTSASSSAPATSSASNSRSANTTRARRPTGRQNNRVYGYQRSAPARNSTVFLPFSVGENDLISDPVPHYSASSIDPPVIEIADNDSSEQSISPPPYSLLPPQTNYPAIPETTFDSAHTPVASSSRRPASLSVTTFVPSSISKRNYIGNGKGRASNTQKMVRYSSPLTTDSTVRRTNGAIQRPSTITPVRANFGSLNRSSSEFRTHLAAASNCRSYTPYDHSKKLKAIEELTGIRNTSVNPFDLVVLKGIRRKPITEVKKCFIDLEVYIDMIGNIKFVDDRTEILVIKSYKKTFLSKLKIFPAIKIVYS
ncbi:hypothetical protein AYI69_g2701 [Smittium culicis]|uniref:Uncharacterized protein n=1 Tax=Smittium culicis TaxID=133412 RepID=A0A1R1YLT1_9FUNG|nr:hypothetical protein AYI69_g2701 [Smittium culicis]